MRTQKINFPNQQALCVFPDQRLHLERALSELGLVDNYPVMVLIGGEVDKQHAEATRHAIQTISEVAEEIMGVIICGGTDMGVMAEIGRIRSRNDYKFPLIGVAPEELVAWPGGPSSTKILLWGKERWQLEPHYTHFVLVPGGQFGDESPWIVDAATLLSKRHPSVTILINGGEVSLKDIELSLKAGRPVIALSRTGRLADEISRQPSRHPLVSVVPANSEGQIRAALQSILAENQHMF